MMKHLTTNERAKRGIPSLAITQDRTYSNNLEGFDRNGHYWYQTFSARMEPVIKQGSYLCLQPVKSTDGIMGLNGEVYLLAIRQPSGDIVTLMGYVVDNAKAGTITLHTISPFPCDNDFKKSQIIEAYVILYSMAALPA